MHTVLATKKVSIFAKQQGGSKARKMGDKTQWVPRSSMLEGASKLLREGKNLD